MGDELRRLDTLEGWRMKLGLLLGYKGAAGGPDMELVLEAERLGYDSVWTSESWASDAVTPAAWVLARTSKIKVGTGIMQMSARTPSCAAMTAMSLQAMSGGRFLLGIGPSGPQVIEGWHGEVFGKPLKRTREYIEIIRKIFERKSPLTFQGEFYQIPNTGPGTTGLGKPLKSIMHPDPNLKIYTGSFAPAGLRTAGAVADGVQPIFMIPEKSALVREYVEEGRMKAGRSANLADFDIAPFVRIQMGDDLQACRDAIKGELAFYIGGMGARTKNFYNDYAKRLGYEDAAVKIQDAFLEGRRADAVAAVPDALVDDIALVGTPDRIKDRLQVWKAAAADRSIGSMLLGVRDIDTLRAVAEAAA
ncbi:MAG TPA: LLM class F420-dependent oxidoreductase [Hyphomicrobiaceae bacterium]|nr:LLM class F420-dependent oxidoreductase [Hyphomicrobiaceae bacterium]